MRTIENQPVVNCRRDTDAIMVLVQSLLRRDQAGSFDRGHPVNRIFEEAWHMIWTQQAYVGVAGVPRQASSS